MMSSENSKKMLKILANPHRILMCGRSFCCSVWLQKESKAACMQLGIQGMGATMAEVSLTASLPAGS